MLPKVLQKQCLLPLNKTSVWTNLINELETWEAKADDAGRGKQACDFDQDAHVHTKEGL